VQAQELDGEDGLIREAIHGESNRLSDLARHLWDASDTCASRAAQFAACLVAAASVAAYRHVHRHPEVKPNKGDLGALARLAPKVVGELPEHARGIWIAAYLDGQSFETYSALRGTEKAHREYRELVRILAVVMPRLALSGST
jgi:hypothetical protein